MSTVEALSRSAFVLLRPTGLSLVASGLRRRLDWRELVLLEILARPVGPLESSVARAAERTGSDPDALRRFTDELVTHSLLTTRPAAADVAGGTDGSEAPPPRDLVGEPAPPGDGRFVALTPVVFQTRPGGFQCLGHDGRHLISLNSRALSALAELGRPATLGEAHARHAARWGTVRSAGRRSTTSWWRWSPLAWCRPSIAWPRACPTVTPGYGAPR